MSPTIVGRWPKTSSVTRITSRPETLTGENTGLVAVLRSAASYGGVLRRSRGLGCGPRARPGLVVLPGAGEPRPGPARGAAGKGF